MIGNCEFQSKYEPRRQKTGLRGFRPGPTQTGLYSHRRWLETRNFGFGKQRDCTIRVAKTKALISFAVTAKLIASRSPRSWSASFYFSICKNPVFSRRSSYMLWILLEPPKRGKQAMLMKTQNMFYHPDFGKMISALSNINKLGDEYSIHVFHPDIGKMMSVLSNINKLGDEYSIHVFHQDIGKMMSVLSIINKLGDEYSIHVFHQDIGKMMSVLSNINKLGDEYSIQVSLTITRISV